MRKQTLFTLTLATAAGLFYARAKRAEAELKVVVDRKINITPPRQLYADDSISQMILPLDKINPFRQQSGPDSMESGEVVPEREKREAEANRQFNEMNDRSRQMAEMMCGFEPDSDAADNQSEKVEYKPVNVDSVELIRQQDGSFIVNLFNGNPETKKAVFEIKAENVAGPKSPESEQINALRGILRPAVERASELTVDYRGIVLFVFRILLDAAQVLGIEVSGDE